MGKNLKYAIIGIIAFLIIIIIAGYVMITGSTTVEAFLNVEEGQVEVDQGNGWVSAIDEMKLGLNDKVKTLEDGYAAIVLYESTIISMDPNTEILIKNLEQANQRIRQETGSTWNKFTGLAGVEGLSIETPTTVATVRGTSFGVNMTEILVGEGEVEVEVDGEKTLVQAEEKVQIKEEIIDGKLRRRAIKKAFTKMDREKAIKKMQRAVRVMQKIRKLEIKKKEFLAKRLQKQYEITDKQVEEHLAKADKGEYDLEEVERKAPVKIETVKKIRRITEKIVDENKAIERLVKNRQALKAQKEALRAPEKTPEPLRARTITQQETARQ